MSVYYNENDPKAAAWLRELIKQGHLPAGDVDERSIEDVVPTDLIDYHQCHFFAGIGGWSYSLALAKWSEKSPVWTGSCPCQPFSQAGKGKGTADERHLWPAWFWLIQQCKPAVIFGEQVASPAGLGWLDLVQADLEGAGYAVGAADLCAAGVGAPHIRQRLYWVGDARGTRSGRNTGAVPRAQGGAGWQVRSKSDQSEPAGIVGISPGSGRERLWNQPAHGEPLQAGAVYCRDGKWRPVEPGTFPLAHGVPGRVGLLRGYGNAIVPQVAAAFIEASGLND